MATEWFCVIGGQRRGPMTWDALAELASRGELGPDDLVWEPAFGMSWRAARGVEGLAVTTPPAAILMPAEPPPPERHEKKPCTPLTGVAGTRPYFIPAVLEAWDDMKGMLFKPLDLARWFSIGFCAWVASIGSGGCSGVSMPDKNMFQSIKNNPEAGAGTMLHDLQGQYRTFMDAHPGVAGMIAAFVVLVVVLVVAWALVSSWLRSRGAFMLVHRWHRPDDTVSQSWAAGRGLGRSLFFWRIGFGSLMLMLLAGLLGALAITVVIPYVHLRSLPPGGLVWLLGLGCALLLVSLCWVITNLLLDAFVVPVMYWRQVGVLDAWRVTLAFCNEQPIAMLIFLILWLLLVISGMLAVLALVLCTCCLFCIPLMIPYVNQVAMLPMTLLMRGVGIRFLRQWRPDL